MTGKLLVILSCTLLSACGSGESFESKIPQPGWYDSIDLVEIGDVGELRALWGGKKRCCIDESELLANNREFYKACYHGIVNNTENEELVVKCLWLMGAGADKGQRIDIQRFLVENFGSHRNSVDRCSDCSPGDTVARVTKDLARAEGSQGQIDRAIARLEDLMDSRGGEISLWVQTEIYNELGKLYLSSEVTNTRKDRMSTAYSSLSAVRSEDDSVERRFERFEKTYKEVMARDAGTQ
jgi:hypothetical protein